MGRQTGSQRRAAREKRRQIQEQIKLIADENGISYRQAERIYNNNNLENEVKEITIQKRPENRGILGWRSFIDYALDDATDLDGMGITGGKEMKKIIDGYDKHVDKKKSGNGKDNADTSTSGGGKTNTWENPWKHRELRSGRLGANERLPSNLRYPYSTINGTQDFIKFSIFEYRRSTQSRIGIRRNRGDRLITSGRESLADEQNNLRNTRDLLGSILLPIPSQVADTNSTGWGESKLNALEADLLAASGNLISGNSGNAEGDFQNVLKKISANSSVVNSWFAKQAVSALIGSNITLDQLLARDQGEIINPNMELLFSGPSLRTFSFNFKLTPRYQREAEVIRTIIKAFKRNMAPKGSGGTVLRTPNIFQLEYVGKAQDYLNRIKLCALQNVSVNYTGDGTFATYQDGAPISSMLTLQFKELTPIYNEDYGAYTDNRDGVGY